MKLGALLAERKYTNEPENLLGIPKNLHATLRFANATGFANQDSQIILDRSLDSDTYYDEL